MPKPGEAKLKERDAEICKRHADGEAYKKIADAYGISSVRVRQIIGKARRRAQWLARRAAPIG
jgi:Mor family transcriptional regulator